MGYRIVYDGQAKKYEVHSERNVFSVFVFIGAALLATALFFWPQGLEMLRSGLIPGEDAVTVQAFHNMTDDLRSGATVGEAVEVFCRFVIHGE